MLALNRLSRLATFVFDLLADLVARGVRYSRPPALAFISLNVASFLHLGTTKKREPARGHKPFSFGPSFLSTCNFGFRLYLYL
jgi:hypothetical protein